MKKITKNLTYLLAVLLLLNSCQSVKDGLTGQKQKNSDEFLVEKKAPLVLPPDFEKLPIPKSANERNIAKEENFKDIIGKEIDISKDYENTQTIESSTEASIIEKIKKN